MDPTVEAFLRDAARLADVTPDEVLRRVLHIDRPGESMLREILSNWQKVPLLLLLELDYQIRVRNPGLHYVDRDTYFGYRREGPKREKASERTQVFLSVIKRANVLTLILPLPPAEFAFHPNVRDLTGRGHHGIGDLKVTVVDATALESFLSVFDDWLRHV
ncbi:hypothetical protein [Paractinoplanes maris]|uniref:hypothetical protein n=1 Tax=Paractinoplanes maris TaxID=1734446 RepID=UPI0020225149|nr:hypothetical protein [Actinoplanes maris]